MVNSFQENPYEAPVRAELVTKPKRGSVAGIIRGMMLWWVAIAALTTVGFIVGGMGHWEITLVLLLALAVLIAGIYRILGLFT
jgi:hypothetical protein